jgi:hypothetical protein
MFDLEQQIDRWKSAFAKKRACSRDELEELESHLREQFAALVAAGLSHEAAFRESVSRLGNPDQLCGEFAKNERPLLWDSVALRGNSVVVALAGLAAAVFGVAVWVQRQDGLLGAHVSSITFAYIVGLLLALVGTYAIFRSASVKRGQAQFRDRFAGHCRTLLSIIAMGGAAGVILGGIWAQREWGRFWAWDIKETGGLAVITCALALYLLVTRLKPTGIRLGQASLMMSLVIVVAWFGPAVYLDGHGSAALISLVVCLMGQLAVLGASILVTKREAIA